MLQDTATMEVTLLQLAVISRRRTMAKEILERQMRKGDPKAMLLKKSRLRTDVGIENYCTEDMVLDGANAVHLAARFSPGSLKAMMAVLDEKRRGDSGLVVDVRAPLTCQGNPLMLSPIHVAAKYNDGSSMKVILEAIAETSSLEVATEARDNKGYTPLHAAARNGNEKNVVLLLLSGADPNASGLYGKTPLHKTRQSTLHSHKIGLMYFKKTNRNYAKY